MSKRISLKLTDKNDWLVEAINKELEETNRPSFNNMVETILVSYFKAKGKKNKNVITKLQSENDTQIYVVLTQNLIR
jgi:hypothetical protein